MEASPHAAKPVSRGRLLLYGWLALHLLCSCLFMFCFEKEGFWTKLPLWSLTPVRLYGAFTGATNSYAFFSPDVSPQLRARFGLHTEKGEIAIPMFPPMNHEAELRVSNLVDMQWEFGKSKKDTEKNRALAASYAGKLLERYPEAHAVSVYVEYFALAKLAQKPRPEPFWQPLYNARYERAKPGAKP